MAASHDPARRAGPFRGGARPVGLRAWRQLLDGRPVTADPDGRDPDEIAAALVRRWYQHFAVAIDGPMERSSSGSERLPEIVDAWLDVARRTAPVRAYVSRFGGPRTAAEQRRQDALLLGLLREDLALIGVPAPQAAAAGLLQEMTRIALAEDRAGRPLRTHRTAALRSAGLGQPAPAGWLRCCPLLSRRAAALSVS